MEVLGAVASTLTLLEVSLKTAGFIQELSQAQSDFESLQEQIVDICVLVGDFTKLPRLFAGTPGLPQISDIASLARASRQLQDVQRELEDVVVHCAQILDDDSARVRKRKWMLQRNRIPKLLDKTRNAKGNLQLAIQMQTCTLAAEQIVLRDRLRSEFTVALESLPIVRDSPPSSIVEGAETGVDSHEDAIGFEETTPAACAVTETEGSCNIPSNEIRRNSECMGQTTLTASSNMQLICPSLENKSNRAQKCPRASRLGRTNYRTPNWLQPLLGSWRVEYARHPGTAASFKSDLCKFSKENTLGLNYRFPKWLCARNLIMEAAFGSSGLRFALRPTRCIPNTDGVWSSIQIEELDLNVHDVRQDFLAYFPSDVGANGCGLIEFSIMTQAYDMLEILLDLWGSILKKQGLPKISSYLAYQQLEKLGIMDDRKRYLLERVVSYVDDLPEWKSTLVHTAAFTGEGMSFALEEESWAKDEFDYLGRSPLQIASTRGNCMALEELVSAGADINIPNHRGWSPLMFAAFYGQVGCVRSLLQAGCDFDQKDRLGSRAIHHAAGEYCPEAITLLLAAGASPSAVDIDGRAPLHHWASLAPKTPITPRECDAFYSRVCQASNLLLLSKDVDIEARAHDGFTPALYAMIRNHVPLLRVLIEAGATLPYVDKFSINFLHRAALYVKDEGLEYLLTVPPEIFHHTNVDLHDGFGETPWDYFLWTMRATTWDLGLARRPSPAEKAAFTQLFKLVRDINIRLEIDSLDSILQQLRTGSLDNARVQLSTLADQKASAEWKEYDLAGWYRGIIQQTRAAQMEDAIVALVEYVDELTAKIGTEP